MEVKINDLSASEQEIEVILSYDEISADIEKEVRNQTKKIELPGFRKGKVPLHILKKRFGDALEYEASEKVANDRFWDAIKERDINPLGQPVLSDIKFEPGSELSFKVKYEVMPLIEVKNYTGHEIEIPDFKVSDEEIEREIDYIRRTNATHVPAYIVEDTDTIIEVKLIRIDENGEPFADAKPETLDIDLSNKNVQQEIVDNAMNKKVGDSFTFSFTDERTLKNKDGSDEIIKENFTYSAAISGIKRIALPALDEELIKKVTKDKETTETGLRKQIRKEIEHYYQHKTDEFLKGNLVSLVIKNNEFVPPAALVKNLLEDMVKKEEDRLKQQRIHSIKRQDLENYLRPQAEMEVKWFILRDAIITKENLRLSDEVLNELAAKDAEKTGIAVEKMVQYYKTSDYGSRIIQQKLFSFLEENNKIKKVDPEKFQNRNAENQ